MINITEIKWLPIYGRKVLQGKNNHKMTENDVVITRNWSQVNRA